MTKSSITSWQIEIAAQSTVVDALRDETDLSVAKIKEALAKGAVWIRRTRNGHAEKPRRIRRAKNVVQGGDQLFMYYNPLLLALTIDEPKLIQDLGHYSVWDKPAGMLCEGTRWADHCALTRVASTNVLADRACFLVHRLDKMTSGLILLAHSKKAANLLSQLFAARKIKKHYRALVHECSTRQPLSDLPLLINQAIDGKPAISHIIGARAAHQLLNGDSSHNKPELLEGVTELEVKIETGRTHQIRRHLKGIGLPVVGDRLYGIKGGEAEDLVDLQLRASYLSFVDPFDHQQRSWSLK